MDKNNFKLKGSTFQWLLVITYAFALYNFDIISGGIKNLSSMLSPFFIGFTIAYLVNIFIIKIEKFINSRTKEDDRLTERGYKLLVLVIYILTLLFVVGILVLIIPSIVSSIENVINNLMSINIIEVSNEVSGFIYNITGKSYDVNDAVKYITERIATILTGFKDILPYVMGATKQAFSILLNLLFGIIISIYMLLNKRSYLKGLNRLFLAFIGQSKTSKLAYLLNKSHTAFTDFISTVLIGAVIVSSITFVVTNIMGISNAILVAIAIAIGNLIPFFGPILGLISASILVLISTPDKVLIYIVFAILLQQFDANVMNPKLVGDKLGLDALLVIFAVIIMSGLFGFLGTFIGVPVFAVIYLFIKEYVNKKLGD